MDSIEKFVEAKKELLNYFSCDGEFFIKPSVDYNWRIKENDGAYFLAYWQEGKRINESVIVRKDGMPMIFKSEKYTMVICIECVKVAIILRNEMCM